MKRNSNPGLQNLMIDHYKWCLEKIKKINGNLVLRFLKFKKKNLKEFP